jgi:hypothetical protein
MYFVYITPIGMIKNIIIKNSINMSESKKIVNSINIFLKEVQE